MEQWFLVPDLLCRRQKSGSGHKDHVQETYTYSQNIYLSRKIEAACRRDINFMCCLTVYFKKLFGESEIVDYLDKLKDRAATDKRKTPKGNWKRHRETCRTIWKEIVDYEENRTGEEI